MIFPQAIKNSTQGKNLTPKHTSDFCKTWPPQVVQKMITNVAGFGQWVLPLGGISVIFRFP